jgi:hypothetical protein
MMNFNSQRMSPRFGQLIPVSIPTGLTAAQSNTLEQFNAAWQSPSISGFVNEAEARGFDVTPKYTLQNDAFQFSAKLTERPGEPTCQYKTDAKQFQWVKAHETSPSLQEGGSWSASQCVNSLISSLRRNLSDIKTFDEREFNLNDLIA